MTGRVVRITTKTAPLAAWVAYVCKHINRGGDEKIEREEHPRDLRSGRQPSLSTMKFLPNLGVTRGLWFHHHYSSSSAGNRAEKDTLSHCALETALIRLPVITAWLSQMYENDEKGESKKN